MDQVVELPVWFLWLLCAEFAGACGFVIFVFRRHVRAVPELEVKVAQLESTTHHDPKTGAFNGLYLLQVALPAAMRSCFELKKSLALLYLDIDGLKAVNSRLGQLAGDRLIYKAVQACRWVLPRSTDGVFRVNTAGDEFVLLLPGAHAKLAARVGLGLLLELKRQNIEGSIGVVTTDRLGRKMSPTCLVEHANRVCEAAKRAGKGCAVAQDAQGRYVVLSADEDTPGRPVLLPEAAQAQ